MKIYFKQKKALFIFVSTLIIINSLFSTLAGLASANALSEVANKNGKQFFIWVAVMAGAYVIYAVVGYLITIFKTKLKQEIDRLIRKNISQRMEKTDYEGFHEQKVATYTSWMTNDITTINNYGVDDFMMIIQQISEIIFGAITLAYFQISLVITVAVLTVIMTIVPNLFSKWMSSRSLELTHANERLVNKINDILEGFNILFLGNALRLITKKIDQASLDVQDHTVDYAKAAGLTQAVTNGIAFLSQVIILAQTGFLILHNLTPVGTVSGAQYFAETIFAELSGISFNWQEFKTVKPILNKFNKIKVQDKIKENQDLSNKQNTLAASDLSFKYPDANKDVFNNLDLNFEAGKKYIIVGDSAAGKTTLLNLLSGLLRQYQGSLSLANIDYKSLSDKQLHDVIGYVQQVPYIFDASLRWNLTLGEDYPDAQLNEVIRQTGLEPLVKDLAGGLDGKLDVNKLSGGQKQRISFARGLLRDKPIYLLDEFTSSLDKKSSLELEKLIMNKPNTTVIMITHHLHKVIEQMADKIINVGE